MWKSRFAVLPVNLTSKKKIWWKPYKIKRSNNETKRLYKNKVYVRMKY